MSKRRTITGRRPVFVWLGILIGLVFIVGVVTILLVRRYAPSLAQQGVLGILVAATVGLIATSLLALFLPQLIRRTMHRFGERPILEITPAVLDLGSCEEGIAISRKIRVTNTTGSPIELSIRVADPWLSISDETVKPPGSAVFEVQVDTADLQEGPYQGLIVARSGWRTKSVPISVHVTQRQRPSWAEGTSVRIKEQYRELLHPLARGITGFAMAREDEVRVVRDIITDFGAGRFILTGYGRFGGTTIVRKVVEEVKAKLKPAPNRIGVLLAVGLDLEDISQPEEILYCLVRELHCELTEQKYNKELQKRLKTAIAENRSSLLLSGKEEELSLEMCIPVPKISLGSFQFNLPSPLKAILSRKAVLSRPEDNSSKYKVRHLIDDMIGLLFDPKRDANALGRILNSLLGQPGFDPRIVIIIDKIASPEVIELMNNIGLFSDARIIYLAVVSREQFDQWDRKNIRRLTTKFKFRRYYVPCLWEETEQFVDRLCDETLNNDDIENLSAECAGMFSALKKHVAFIGRGAPGDITWELFDPKYWYRWQPPGARSGQWYLRLDSLPDANVVRHHAWLQDVLEDSWDELLEVAAPEGRPEDKDRVKRGAYELLVWMERTGRFTKDEVLESSKTQDVLIALTPRRRDEAVTKLLEVLDTRGVLHVDNEVVSVQALPPLSPERHGKGLIETSMEGSQVKATAQIFLSYARPDEGKVKNLYQKLSDAGFKPWMDKKDILPGEIWQSCIQKAIEHSDFFLACLSPNSINRRGFLQREIKDALDIWQEMLEDDIYLIPVRLEDCEAPESLRKFQWVNLFEEDGWTRLVKSIEKGMERRVEGWK